MSAAAAMPLPASRMPARSRPAIRGDTTLAGILFRPVIIGSSKFCPFTAA